MKIPQKILDLQSKQGKIMKELSAKQKEVQALKGELQKVMDEIAAEIKKI